MARRGFVNHPHPRGALNPSEWRTTRFQDVLAEMRLRSDGTEGQSSWHLASRLMTRLFRWTTTRIDKTQAASHDRLAFPMSARSRRMRLAAVLLRVFLDRGRALEWFSTAMAMRTLRPQIVDALLSHPFPVESRGGQVAWGSALEVTPVTVKLSLKIDSSTTIT